MRDTTVYCDVCGQTYGEGIGAKNEIWCTVALTNGIHERMMCDVCNKCMNHTEQLFGLDRTETGWTRTMYDDRDSVHKIVRDLAEYRKGSKTSPTTTFTELAGRAGRVLGK